MKKGNRKSQFTANLLSAALASVGRPGIEGEQTADFGGGTATPPPAAPAKAPKVKTAKKAKPAKVAKKAKAKGKAAKPRKASAPGSMAAILHAAAKGYAKPKNAKGEALKTPAGNPVIDCGDDVAKMLRGKDLKTVYEVVAGKMNVTVASLKARYSSLNDGQQRMNLGNRLRGHLNPKPAKAKKAKAK